MKNKYEIYDKKGKLLAYKITSNVPEGLTAYSDDKDFIQVLSWNYQKGKKLAAHTHLKAIRKVIHTQECVIVMKGSMVVEIFDDRNKSIKKEILNAGEGMILLHGGHGYEILKNGTKIFEIKNGPYPGPESDRKRIMDFQL